MLPPLVRESVPASRFAILPSFPPRLPVEGQALCPLGDTDERDTSAVLDRGPGQALQSCIEVFQAFILKQHEADQAKAAGYA